VAQGPAGLGLTVVIDSVDGAAVHVAKMAKTDGHGSYRMRVDALPAGLYDVKVVRSSSKSKPVDEVSDTFLVYSGTDLGE
jgi:hypothetical protein